MCFCVKYKYNDFLCKLYGFCIFAEKRTTVADTMTESQRHFTMSQVHSSSTKPELKLRHALWRHGFRYRINAKQLPGKPDIVLPKYRTAIFVHGCFWHGHDGCGKYTVPKTNTEFWTAKVTRNRERDQETWRQLEAKGWSVIIVWECQLKKTVLEETIARVKAEIIRNGDRYQREKEERKASRTAYLQERKARKEREAAYLKKSLQKSNKLPIFVKILQKPH